MNQSISLYGESSVNYHGREEEQQLIQKLLLLSEEESQYLVISGQAGSGKTALIDYCSHAWESNDSQDPKPEQSTPTPDTTGTGTSPCTRKKEARCIIYAVAKFEDRQSAQPFTFITNAVNDLCQNWAATKEGRHQARLFRRESSQQFDNSILSAFLPKLYNTVNVTLSTATNAATTAATVASTAATVATSATISAANVATSATITAANVATSATITAANVATSAANAATAAVPGALRRIHSFDASLRGSTAFGSIRGPGQIIPRSPASRRIPRSLRRTSTDEEAGTKLGAMAESPMSKHLPRRVNSTATSGTRGPIPLRRYNTDTGKRESLGQEEPPPLIRSKTEAHTHNIPKPMALRRTRTDTGKCSSLTGGNPLETLLQETNESDSENETSFMGQEAPTGRRDDTDGSDNESVDGTSRPTFRRSNTTIRNSANAFANVVPPTLRRTKTDGTHSKAAIDAVLQSGQDSGAPSERISLSSLSLLSAGDMQNEQIIFAVGQELKSKENSFDRLKRILLLLLKAMTNNSTGSNDTHIGRGSDHASRNVMGKLRTVVIFFDDLQFADPQSLRLVQDLVEENIPGLFLVSAFRSEDVNADDQDDEEDDSMHQQLDRLIVRHPVVRQLDELTKESKQDISRRVHKMHLKGFKLDEICKLLSAAMGEKDQTGKLLPLAEVILEKTLGNPLFVEQFVQILQREGHLKFSLLSCSWEWSDVQDIRQAMKIISSEVADAIVSSLKELDKDTQRILKVASCAGTQILPPVIGRYLELMKTRAQSQTTTMVADEAKTDDKSERQLEVVLEELVRARIIRRREAGSSVYYWAHAKLQQAAFSLMAEEERYQVHLGLGKLLLKDLTSRTESSTLPREIVVYLAADQLNQVPIPTLAVEGGNILLLDLANLNYEAAKLSIAKSAFHPAVKLLRSGIHVLEEENPFPSVANIWSRNYKLALALHNSLAEMCYTVGDHEAAKETIDEILRNTTCKEDQYRAQSCFLEIVTNGKDRDILQGANMCIEYLKPYGIDFPKKATDSHIFMERRRLNQVLPTGRLEELCHQKFISSSDPGSKCVAVFLGKLTSYSFLAGDGSLCELSSLKSFRHALKNGISIYTALAMAMYAATKRQKQKFEKAYTRASIAEDMLKALVAKPGHDMIKARVLVSIHGGLIPMKRPIQDSLDPFLEAHRSGMRSGDVEYAALATMMYGYSYLFCGLPLGHLEADMASYGEESRQMGVTPSICVQFPIMQQTALSLMGKSQNPVSLQGGAMDKAETFLSVMQGHAQSMTLRDTCIFRLFLACVYGDYVTCEELIEKLSAFPHFNPCIVRMHIRHAFTGCAAFAIARSSSGPKKSKFVEIGRSSLKYFQEYSQQGSLNAYPISEFLSAEETPSKASFDKAISVCARSGLKSFEAMSNESCGLYFLDQDDEDWAAFYLVRAVELYEEWGARGKAKRVRSVYPFVNAALVEKEGDCASHRSTSAGLKGKRTYRPSTFDKTNEVVFGSQELNVSGALADDSELSSTGKYSSFF